MKQRWPIIVLVALCGCAQSLRGPLTLPNRYGVVREQLALHGDFPLAKHHRLFEELVVLRGDLCRRLRMPASDEPIDVYLFETSERFEGFMRLHHPGFPHRRAFFVETDTRLVVYAQWGDRVAEDLRHEVTHGYLHAVIPNLPLWLDEGLAEYFEVARGHRGLNRDHVRLLKERLHQGDWRPDIARLESLDPTIDMNQTDYAESWAWVHFMLESGGEPGRLLCDYVDQLRHEGSAEPLSARLARTIDRPADALALHVHGLRL